jgi:leucyl/phenylalanyl-tRNA--protein transferase
MYLLDDDLWFPDVSESDPDGLLAIGGDLSAERLILAYRSGIFPWFNEGDPVVWWSPDPRMVLFPEEVIVSKSMRNVLRKEMFTITYNTAFREVISECSRIPRQGQNGTWITDDMIAAYVKLHEMGFARSVEVWMEGKLVGGLYGIDLGHIFCGESMFSKATNASKAAFIYLCRKLNAEGYRLLDCQIYNDHLASLGAREIPRADFMSLLQTASSSRSHDH